MVVAVRGFAAGWRAANRNRNPVRRGRHLPGKLRLGLLLLLLFRQSRRDDAALPAIQEFGILFVDLPELLRGRIRTDDVEMPVLHEIIISIAAAGFAPAGEFRLALGQQ